MTAAQRGGAPTMQATPPAAPAKIAATSGYAQLGNGARKKSIPMLDHNERR